MSFNDMMSKIRYLDNRCARWMMNHFYFLFFQLVLAFAFLVYLVTVLNTLELGARTAGEALTERLLYYQNIQFSILIFLAFLNSFWMLFIFSGMSRIRYLLKDISYFLSRRPGSERRRDRR